MLISFFNSSINQISFLLLKFFKKKYEMFDPDKYIEELNVRKYDQLSVPLKHPQNKVPPNNLFKLGFEKKVVNIILDIKIQEPPDPLRPLFQPKFFILRDRFDWDLNQSNIRPKVFA